MQRVRVNPAHTKYDVVIGRDVLERPDLRRCLGPKSRGIVVSSKSVMALHGQRVLAALSEAGFDASRVVNLPDGEGAKTASSWEAVMRAMAKDSLDRSSFVIAFGGGSIGDVAGFAAATYMRGVRLIQIPTTLLSMVDSSVGGKTGINLEAGKNLVGAFHQPDLVIADLTFLGTLSARERQSGVYEILKCALLRSGALLKLIERTGGLRRASALEIERAVAAAVRIKARVVSSDERESGDRILLNFGHTLGHALEAATAYRVFTHGEGVGYGMEFAADFSQELGLLSEKEARRIRTAISQVGPKVVIQARIVAKTGRATLTDKKRNGAQLKEVLLRGIAKPVVHRLDAKAFATLASGWLVARAAGAA